MHETAQTWSKNLPNIFDVRFGISIPEDINIGGIAIASAKKWWSQPTLLCECMPDAKSWATNYLQSCMELTWDWIMLVACAFLEMKALCWKGHNLLKTAFNIFHEIGNAKNIKSGLKEQENARLPWTFTSIWLQSQTASAKGDHTVIQWKYDYKSCLRP